MVKKDVIDFGYGKDHFNEYMIYKRGEGGDDIDGWTVDEMKSVITEYNKHYGGDREDAVPALESSGRIKPPQLVKMEPVNSNHMTPLKSSGMSPVKFNDIDGQVNADLNRTNSINQSLSMVGNLGGQSL
jgi:hypothetical protein